jgi:beta-lactam-binding protein with PASTA domain
MIEATTATARFALADCVVPKVKGKTFKATKAALKARFCSVGKVRRVFSSTVRPGHVVSQRPKARTHLKHRGKVNLVVSRGRHTH